MNAAPDLPLRTGGTAMAIGIVVMSLMLRPIATEVGPVLAMVQSDLHLGGTLAGLVGSLPPACFAVFGFTTPPLVQRLGIHRTLVLALVALLAGGLARAFAHGSVGFIAWSALALAGAAICNVLAPSLIRLHFGGRIALMTAMFSLGISVGAATGVISYPLALALGGWRTSFAVMSSTVLVAVLLWLRTWQFDRRATPSGNAPQPNHPSGTSMRPSLGRVARTRLGWCMAIYFGAQSAQAYSMFAFMPSIFIGAGLSPETGANMLLLNTVVSIPLAFVMPALTARMPNPWPLQVVIGLCAVGAYVGLLVAPATVPWLWSSLLAVGLASFPVALALFAIRSRTPAGTVALSGFGQGVGYGLAILGPFGVGLLHDLTGSWTVPVGFLLAVVVPMTLCGLTASFSPTIEQELGV